MNIQSIQTGQLTQNVIKSAERGPSPVENRTIAAPAEAEAPQPSEAAIVAGISFLQEQLTELLTSFPPFFPAGSYQRADLIRGIKTIEEKVGKAVVDESLKKMFSEKQLTADASDDEISFSLDRLLVAKNQLVEKTAAAAEPVKAGSFVSVKV